MAEETEVFGASPAYLDSFHRQIDGIRRPMLRTRFLAQGVPALYQSVALLLLVLALGVIALVGMREIASLAAVVLILLPLAADEASAAKLWHTDLQWEVCDASLQLHGGAGYMNEYLIARLWRDARVTRIFGGTNEIMKEVVSRAI